MGTLTVQGTKSVCFTRCDVCITAIACDTFQNMLYLWLRFDFVLLFGRFWNLGNFFLFAFLASVFIRRRRLYTYKLQEAIARRQDISISEKRHLYITLAACCVVVSLFC